MCKKQWLALLFLIAGTALFAQDTVRVRKSTEDEERYCTLQICCKKECFSDTVPLSFFNEDAKPELRINDDCLVKKRAEVFVSSFEVSTDINNVHRSSTAQSSFFTGPQLNIISSVKKGETFNLSNVTVHGPDGFSRMENLKITIK